MSISDWRQQAARVLAVLILGTAAVSTVGIGAPVTASAGPSSVLLTDYGADTCTAPSESQMRAFWNNTPYSYWGIYIGGADRGCSQPNLTSRWVSDMLATGWNLLPIWVGPQNPCTPGQAAYFSSNPTTARQQGMTEAQLAYNAWHALSSIDSVPLDYDLESGSYDSPTCRAAAQAFIDGWVTQLHVAPAQTAGVYTSSCSGYLDDFSTLAHNPDFIDGADWDGSPSSANISCVKSTHWYYHQRHKQYLGGHNATYNGVTLNIDSRCADGPVYGMQNNLTSGPACGRAGSSAPAAVQAVDAATAPVSWHGQLWRSGGALDAQLQRAVPGTAANGTWTAVQVGTIPIVSHDVAPTADTVGTPVALSDGTLVVPVTRHATGGTQEVLYATTDGRTFTVAGTVQLPGTTGAGVAAVTSVVGGDHIAIVSPDSSRIVTWSAGAQPAATTAHGLPAAPQSVHFSSPSAGQAVVETGTCAGSSKAAKAACAPQLRIFRTDDGGRTWSS